jgi:methionyl-tRNA formyltransferase
VTATRLIRKEDAIIDWAQPAYIIERQVRAYSPWPGTQTTWRGQPLRIVAAHNMGAGDMPPGLPADAPPGTVIAWGRGNAHVAIICGDRAALVLDVVQLPAKRAAAAADVVRGQPSLIGAQLPS